ncbi:MAG: serine hydrolase [Paenisporosarcina sp.]
MQKVIEKLKEVESNEVGIIIYSNMEQKIVSSFNSEIKVPLASAAKVAIGFCIAKWVEEGHLMWNDIIEGISLNPEEDSKILYPHLQQRRSLALHEAVEVMIACHDSYIANKIVQVCGGWDKVNAKMNLYFNTIHITQNSRDLNNSGELSQLLELLCLIYQGYKTSPKLWTPLINGLVRQQDEVKGIPPHLLNHMTGGLENVVVDVGIIGEFHQNPLLYVLAAKNLPSRFENEESDQKIMVAMELLYKEYLKQEVGVPNG